MTVTTTKSQPCEAPRAGVRNQKKGSLQLVRGAEPDMRLHGSQGVPGVLSTMAGVWMFFWKNILCTEMLSGGTMVLLHVVLSIFPFYCSEDTMWC